MHTSDAKDRADLLPTITETIFAAAGQRSTSTIEGDCRTCGARSSGVPFLDWVKATFTDHDKLRPGDIVCDACLFLFSDQNIEIQSRLGKEKPQKSRNYSHFVVGGVWHPLTKGQKRQMVEYLLSPDCTVAIIADSGQKHLAFRGRPGYWQFEEQRLHPCPELLREMLAPIEQLYNAGASKGEIETGRYSQYALQAIGISRWRELEAQIARHRGGLPFKLAVFLCQKNEEEVHE